MVIRKLQAPALAHATDTLTPGPPLPPGHPSAALLAKLHLYTASLYEQALSLVQAPDHDGRRPMHKLRQTLRRHDREVAPPLLRYLEHEAQWHKGIGYKWFGIDAGENGRTGSGLTYLGLAHSTLSELVPRSAIEGERPKIVSLWEQRRAAKFGGSLVVWRMALEHASVTRWLGAYRRLNDTVSFQRVPPVSEIQLYMGEGRAALAPKTFEPPAPAFGRRVGGSATDAAPRRYVGAGAYY